MKKLIKIEEAFVIILVAALTLLVFIAALMRNIGHSLQWSMELAQLIFGWTCAIGADLALRTKSHMGVDMFVKKLPKAVQKIVKLVLSFVTLAFLSLAIYYGYMLVFQNWQRRAQTLPISYSFVTLAIPVGCTLMWIEQVRQIIEAIRNWHNNEEGSAQ